MCQPPRVGHQEYSAPIAGRSACSHFVVVTLLPAALAVVVACVAASGQKPDRDPSTPAVAQDQKSTSTSDTEPQLTKEQIAANEARRAAYPTEWEVPIDKNTKLDELRQRLDKQVQVLPPKDLDDQTPIPIWFRVYLRKTQKALADSGPYQYPRTATRLLQRMRDNPNSIPEDVK